MTVKDTQERQHNTESEYLDKLKQWCNEHKHTFRKSTTEEDRKLGIDCYIDFKPYDLKGTTTNHLTVLKYYTQRNVWYNPLIRHMEVPYILPLNEEGSAWKVVNKVDVLNWYYEHPDLVGRYDGDGNKNLWVDISNMNCSRFV